MLIVVAACGDDAPVATTGATTTETATSLAPSTLPPSTATEPPTTVTTMAPSTTAAPPSTTAPGKCPELAADAGPDAEVIDVVLAAWNRTTGELLWEIPLGTRLPRWGVWSDEVILGFTGGELVGIDVVTCDSWSITLRDGIDDLWVSEEGTSIVRSGSELAGFSGRGFGNWRFDPFGPVLQLVGQNAGVSVFADVEGGLIALETGGGAGLFEWGGAAADTAVSVSESFVFRSTGAEVAARPVRGGDVVWTSELAGVRDLFSVPGTLAAQTDDELIALDPATGEERWRIGFGGEISGPIVLDHGELHIASREGSLSHTLWHLDPNNGATVFRADAPAGKEWFSEMDDGLLLESGSDGVVRGITMMQRTLFELETGADPVGRFTHVELARGGVVVTLTFSAERF